MRGEHFSTAPPGWDQTRVAAVRGKHFGTAPSDWDRTQVIAVRGEHFSTEPPGLASSSIDQTMGVVGFAFQLRMDTSQAARSIANGCSLDGGGGLF